jgi:hypothetical protein
VVDGGSCAREPLLASAFADYQFYVDVFFGCIDRRYGNWSQLPFGGGYLNQPAYTMAVLGIMRGVFLDKLSETPSL